MTLIDPERLSRLKALAGQMPTSPGVYLMKNEIDKIIYVGKAKNLKNRVRSYFLAAKTHSAKTVSLVARIQSLEFISTRTEVEAFLLEASLIKKHRPRYNIRLKDDKTYPYIRISMGDEFPRLYLSRKVKKDGSQYFGPYTSGLVVHDTIKYLNRAFRIRDCSDHFFRNRTRPCLTHQIGFCTAPCVGLISKQDYKKDVESAQLILKGRDRQALKELSKRMKEEAASENFEAAAKMRDSLFALKAILEKQAVFDAQGENDQDVIGFEGDDRGCTIEVLHVRQGKLLGGQAHYVPLLNPNSDEETPQDWLSSFINQYYEDNVVPDELLLPVDLGRDLHHLIADVLHERSGHKVVVRYPTGHDGKQLLELAQHNAREHFTHYVSKSERKQSGLKEIQEKLGLKAAPTRIECYDISNFQGAESVASQVVFEDGVPLKDDYRRYKIKTVEGANDFAMMKEVLSRRLKHTEWEEPSLIVVDGGKGQLSSSVAVLKEFGKAHIPVVGLAKARAEKQTEERIFIPGRQNPVTFAKNSEALHILTGIRDEAHRFAITYHRKLREARSLESELDAITGLGEKRKRILLNKFESLDRLRVASVAEIADLVGFNQVLAERVLLHLNEEEQAIEE